VFCIGKMKYFIWHIILISLLPLSALFPQQRFIAILPFTNNGSLEFTWVERGIEEILYDKMSDLQTLKVFERETILHILQENGIQSESDINIRKAFSIGKETGVDILITGSYGISGSTLVLNYRTISTYTGADVFRRSYEGPMDDIFTLLENAILESIKTMSLSLPASDREMLARRSTNSINAFQYYCKAYVNFQQGGSMESVASLFNQAIALDPDFWEAQYNLGVIFFNFDQYSRALSQFQKVVDKNPSFYKPYYGMGIIFFLQREYQKSIESYNKVLQLSPDHDRALYYLGRIYVRMDSLDTGLKYLNKSVEINPNYAPAHYHAGLANMKRGWYKSAVQGFRSAIKLDPENYLAYNSLGECFYALQRFDEAIYQYKKAVSIQQNFSTAYFNIGNTIYKKSALQDIVDSYLEILESRYSKNTEDASKVKLVEDLRSLRSESGASQQVYTEMIKAYRNALNYEMTFFEASFNLALTYEKTGMLDSAKYYYQQTIANNTELVRAHMRLGRVYESEGNYEQALQQFKEVVKIEPSYFAATPRLGEEYRYVNIIDDVLKEYQTRLDLNPNNPETLLVLARIFNSIGRYGQAERYYQQLVQLDPKNREASRELRNLQRQRKEL
jgi:tetratricopeptide (TPR) repeat protein